jgi:peptidoglycan DL-endopeptidase CwlO
VTTRTHRARHRAARRPMTQLIGVAQTVANSTAGRRAAVVATASGILVSTIGGAAHAAPAQHEAASKLSTVDLGALTEQARQALEAAPVVTVAADAKLSVETATVAVTPAPKPEPVVERETTTASRTAERTATDTAEASAEAAPAPAPASGLGAQVVSVGMRYLGVPYVSGGSTPSGFDCSGFTSYVFAQLGIDLPHSSSSQHYSGTQVSAADRQPGDLVWSPGHIAIYAGDGLVLEANSASGEVVLGNMWMSNPEYIRVG